MRDPFIHQSLEVQRKGLSTFGVFAKDYIPLGTVVEICAVIPVSRAALKALEKTKSTINEKIQPYPEGLRKEREMLSSISEMEIQRRLDEGTLTPEEAKNILLGAGNLMGLMDVEIACILTGYGALYNRSSYPNITFNFDLDTKLYSVVTVKDIGRGTELTYLRP